MQGTVVAITWKLTRDKVLYFELGNEEFGFVHLILDSSFFKRELWLFKLISTTKFSRFRLKQYSVPKMKLESTVILLKYDGVKIIIW